MVIVSLVHGIVMPRTTSYALNDNIQLKYLGYFHDVSLYIGISLRISSAIIIPLSSASITQWNKTLLIEYNYTLT